MAGGQGITSGQGSVTPSESKSLSGSAVTSSPGTLSADLGPTLQALTGEGSVASAGTAVGSRILSLRSRKVGGGSASRALVGIPISSASGSILGGPGQALTTQLIGANQGSFGKSRSVTASGISISAAQGAVSAPSQSSGPLASDFRLTSSVGGTNLPFALGYSFRQGDVPSGQIATTSDASNWQCTVKATWPDGSLKFAILAGRKTLTAGVAATVTLTTASPSGGTSLTTTNLKNTGITASISCGSSGSASWSGTDFDSPFISFISGPTMSSWVFRKQVGSDTHLRAWMEIRLFVSGEVEVLPWVENGFLDVAGATARTETFSFTLGGTQRYSGALTLYPQQTIVLSSGWPMTHWLGTDPGCIPSHNTSYLISTKLVPNYWKRSPSATALNAQTQTYTPGGIGGHTTPMGSAGYQNAIGILPRWDALYCTSGDSRAFKAVEVNSAHFRTFPIAWRDSATGTCVQPTLRPTWTFFGAGGGGGYTRSAGSNQWELNHHPSAGFTAYLATGRWFHYDTLCLSSATCYLANSSTQGSGTSRMMNSEDRGTAWTYRTHGQLAAIAGSETIGSEYRTLTANNISWWRTNRVEAAGMNLLGYIHSYQLSTGAYGVGRLGPWMHSWWVAVNGYLYDMKSLSSQTNLTAVRDWMYKIPVGYLGVSGNVNSHSFTKAGQYSLKVADTQNNDPTTWYDSWGDVHTNSYGSSNSVSSNTLDAVTDPHQGNGWGETLGAIAYACDHNATGAVAAWNRLSGASNWASTFGAADFDGTPQFGITPRNVTVLQSLAADMVAGEWRQVTGTNLATTMFSTGASNTIDYLDKGCYDETHRQIRFIGAGHLTDLRWHQYDEDTNTWSVLVDPPWDGGSPESSAAQPGNGGAAPFNFHGYQNNAMDPVTGDQFVRRFGGSGTIHRYTRATNTWTTLAAQGSGSFGVGATEWLPTIGSQGGLITLQYDTVQRWDKQAGTFSNFTIPVPRENHPIAVRSVPNNIVLFGGGDNGNNLYSMSATGGITTRTSCPIGMGVTRSVTTACPVSGDLIVIGGSGNARKYNVATDTWSTLTLTGVPAAMPAVIADTTYVMAIPITSYGVIAFLFPSSPQMWLYKHV